MMSSRLDAVSVIHLGLTIMGDSEKVEQPNGVGGINVLPRRSKIAARRAATGFRRARRDSTE